MNNYRVPTVKLLVKDHKKPDEKGDFPTRLVVPAKNFAAAYPHLGQQGIKAILDQNNVDYQRKTIIQASHLKEQLEELPIRRSQHAVMSIDAEKMYPSIKFNRIELAVNHFLRNAPKKDKQKAKKCLELAKYEMDNTLISFEGRYWIFGGFLPMTGKRINHRRLRISIFVAPVAAYILEKSEDIFEYSLFFKIY